MLAALIIFLSQWESNLRRGSTADRLLGLRVRMCLGIWLSAFCALCVVRLSGRGLCDWPMPWPEKSYLLLHVSVCDHCWVTAPERKKYS
jgi:hypothetical protein